MANIKNRIEKMTELQMFCVVVAVFLLSLLVRYGLADFNRVLRTYPDELRYYTIAENLASGRGLKIYNLSSDFQKILYSLILAPAFLVKNRMLQLRMIAFTNAMVMSSAIFPVYLISKRILKNKVSILVLCLFFPFVPELSYSMTFMSEVCFFPVALWTLCAVFYLMEEKDKIHPVVSVLTGIVMYMLYLCKEVGVTILLTYAGVVVLSYIYKKIFKLEVNRQAIKNEIANMSIVLSIFILCFISMKLLLFQGMGNSYNQTSIEILFEEGHLTFVLYGFLYYIMNVVIAAGFFPVILPAVYFGDLPGYIKKKYVYVILLILLNAAVVAYTITVREDFQRGMPRAHLRYLCYIWIPVLCFFLQLLEDHLSGGKWKQWLFAFFSAAVIFKYYKGALDASTVDQTMLKYLMPSNNKTLIAFKILLIITVFAAWITYRKQQLLFSIVFISVFSILQIHNNTEAIRANVRKHQVSNADMLDIENIEKMIKENQDKRFMIVGKRLDYTQGLADTYLNYPNVYTVDINSLMDMQSNDKDILSEQEIPALLFGGTYSLKKMDYILLKPQSFVQIDEEDCTELGWVDSRFFDVYAVHDPSELPHIRDVFQMPDSTCPVVISNGEFSSDFIQKYDEEVRSTGKGYLYDGPNVKIPAGNYTFTCHYRYEGKETGDTVIGHVDVNGDSVDPEIYRRDFTASSSSVVIENVNIEQDMDNFELRMWSDFPGIVADRIEIQNRNIPVSW